MRKMDRYINYQTFLDFAFEVCKSVWNLNNFQDKRERERNRIAFRLYDSDNDGAISSIDLEMLVEKDGNKFSDSVKEEITM
jgi:Ca2+-binding EF-hand superfamily protein